MEKLREERLTRRAETIVGKTRREAETEKARGFGNAIILALAGFAAFYALENGFSPATAILTTAPVFFLAFVFWFGTKNAARTFERELKKAKEKAAEEENDGGVRRREG